MTAKRVSFHAAGRRRCRFSPGPFAGGRMKLSAMPSLLPPSPPAVAQDSLQYLCDCYAPDPWEWHPFCHGRCIDGWAGCGPCGYCYQCYGCGEARPYCPMPLPPPPSSRPSPPPPLPSPPPPSPSPLRRRQLQDPCHCYDVGIGGVNTYFGFENPPKYCSYLSGWSCTWRVGCTYRGPSQGCG